MRYKLVHSETVDEPIKAIGEDVWFDDLPSDYSVCLFYYPGTRRNKDFASKLKDLGDSAGNHQRSLSD
jgi:hypothetical protein